MRLSLSRFLLTVTTLLPLFCSSSSLVFFEIGPCQLLEKRLKLQRRKLGHQLRQDGASDDEADLATEALEIEQDAEKAALEAELAQIRNDCMEKLLVGDAAGVDGSVDGAGELLAAEREAQRLTSERLAAEAARKRKELSNRLKLKRRQLAQQLKQIDASNEDVDVATEELELEHEEERHELESKLDRVRWEGSAQAKSNSRRSGPVSDEGNVRALLRAEHEAKRKLDEQLDTAAKRKREVCQCGFQSRWSALELNVRILATHDPHNPSHHLSHLPRVLNSPYCLV